MSFWNTKSLNSFEMLFIDQLQDLFDAEQRLIKALPRMADAAHDESLKAAFEQHLNETKGHVSRLQRIFDSCDCRVEAQTCQAMKGLISEGNEALDARGNPEVKDAALIAAAQRIEHYEMAGYGTARAFAQRLGRPEAARLLQETLDEEIASDRQLTQLAESSINQHALRA